MSDETPQTPENDGALDLSGLNFGPAWARDPSESKSLKEFKDRGDREDRGDSRGRNDRHDRRGSGGGGGYRDQRGGGGGGGDRRSGGGGGFRSQGGGQGRRDLDNRAPREEVEPPPGFQIQLMPAEESLDLLARQVIDSGRTYSVFDLAKVLLQSRDRFRVTYESPEKTFFRCREDQSLWLTRDEALRHLWKADWLSRFYEEVRLEVEAPKGSFSAVAKCGLSGELLGPPNYHGYQEKLLALHRERFSNMPLDAYKSKVRMEHGEEAVEAWLESMKVVNRWKVKTASEEPAPEGEAAANAEVDVTPDVEDDPSEAVAEEVETVSEEVSDDSAEAVEAVETPEGEASSFEEPAEEISEEPEAVPAEDAVPGILFEDVRALERHFSENHFEGIFEETNRAWVNGNIQGNFLSPGLLTLLKRCVAEEKRYPSNLMPLVCRQLSGRHVAVFKWDKKLKVGPSRPHAVSSETSLAARPQAMIDFLKKNSGALLKDFWAAVRPPDVTDQQKHDWIQDFQWLLSQGHVIFLSDTSVHLAKRTDGEPRKAPQRKSAKPKAGSTKAKYPKEEDPKPETPESETPESETPEAEESVGDFPKEENPTAQAPETKPVGEAEPAPAVEEPAPEAEKPAPEAEKSASEAEKSASED